MAISANYTSESHAGAAVSVNERHGDSRKGYAYNDAYGFAHVLDDYETALKYSGDGKVYAFEGRFGGGYALDKAGNRASLPLPGTVAYGNDVREGVTPNRSEGTFALIESMMAASRALQMSVTDQQEEKSDALSRNDGLSIAKYL